MLCKETGAGRAQKAEEESIARNRPSAASGSLEYLTGLSRSVFLLPLAGYWLLAIVTAFHPRPLWVLSIFALPLVLTAAAVVGKLAGRA